MSEETPQSWMEKFGSAQNPEEALSFLDSALALDANYLATGHYARVEKTDGSYLLRQAVDVHKDQSYVLHVLRQEHLAHVKFPVGNYTKEEVRQLAHELVPPSRSWWASCRNRTKRPAPPLSIRSAGSASAGRGVVASWAWVSSTSSPPPAGSSDGLAVSTVLTGRTGRGSG